MPDVTLSRPDVGITPSARTIEELDNFPNGTTDGEYVRERRRDALLLSRARAGMAVVLGATDAAAGKRVVIYRRTRTARNGR